MSEAGTHRSQPRSARFELVRQLRWFHRGFLACYFSFVVRKSLPRGGASCLIELAQCLRVDREIVGRDEGVGMGIAQHSAATSQGVLV
jgi:hypothetical protein